MTVTLADLNTMTVAAFTETLGAIFEHAPWVAAGAASRRPFTSRHDLHRAMVNQVERAGEGEKLALLLAHPMLARPAPLTAASAAEQASHGLTNLDAGEAAAFAAANEAYHARFGFPFIIAVRGQRDRAAILAALQARLTQSPASERATALAEVAKIARFRIDTLVEPAGWLSVHVLDTARGMPGADLTLGLSRLGETGPQIIATATTNQDGRCDAPLLAGAAMRPGIYEISFAVGAWRAARGEPDPGFYDAVPIRFRVDDPDAHYHVPLLISPYGYATYRGS